MFTGIVTAVGRIAGSEPCGGDRRLTIECDALSWDGFVAGESIAVNGVCLTATGFHGQCFEADVSNETLAVTTLGRLPPGSAVNLEPALALGARLGGHLVSGHVDGIGTVRECRHDARARRLAIEVPPSLGRYIAGKGSVCVDGVSLTVNEVSGDVFGVAIIPHTLDATIIGGYRTGTAVNIEVDVMARHLERLLEHGSGEGMSRDFLKAHGYGN